MLKEARNWEREARNWAREARNWEQEARNLERQARNREQKAKNLKQEATSNRGNVWKGSDSVKGGKGQGDRMTQKDTETHILLLFYTGLNSNKKNNLNELIHIKPKNFYKTYKTNYIELSNLIKTCMFYYKGH